MTNEEVIEAVKAKRKGHYRKRKKRVNKTKDGKHIVTVYCGSYTGERLRREEPEKYERIVGMLAMGHTYRQIRAETGVDMRVIGAINHNNGGQSAVAKRIAQNLRTFAVDAAEELAERGVDKIGLNNIAFPLGIAIDKAQLLSGSATVITESRVITSSAEEWAKAFEAIKAKAQQAQQATITDSAPPHLNENTIDSEFITCDREPASAPAPNDGHQAGDAGAQEGP